VGSFAAQRQTGICGANCVAMLCPLRLPKLFERSLISTSSWCGTSTALHLNRLAAGRALVAGSHFAAAAQLRKNPALRQAWEALLRAVFQPPEPQPVAAVSSTVALDGSADAARGRPRARIISVGGSMIAGVDCADASLGHEHSPNCAFPQRVVNTLVKDIGARDLDLVSLATGGMTMRAQLPGLPLLLQSYGEEARAGVPTLLIIDYSANDVLDGPWSSEDTHRQRRRTTEALARYLLTEQPQMAALLFESYYAQADNTAVPRAYEEVSLHYGLPHIRYANVIADGHLAYNARCPLAKNAHEQLGCHPHVRWTAHQVMADVLITTLMQLGSQLLVPSQTQMSEAADALTVGAARVLLPDPIEANLPTVCEPIKDYVAARHWGGRRVHKGSQVAAALNVTLRSHALLPLQLVELDATQDLKEAAVVDGAKEAAKSPRVTQGNWTLHEDRRGKPGWISTGPNGSTIEFDLEFGAVPTASLVYLSGYSGDLAEVRVRMKSVSRANPKSANNVAMIDALRHDGLNVTQSALFEFDASDARMQNYAMEPHRPAPRRVLPARGTGTQVYDTSEGHHGFGFEPFSRGTMEVMLFCRASPCKFKLLSVSSC